MGDYGESIHELFKLINEGKSKYAYFLLAAAGGALALAVNQTQGAQLKASQIPLAIAVVCWLASFLSGCLHLQSTTESHHVNSAFLQMVNAGVDRSTDEETRQSVNFVLEGCEAIRKRTVIYGRLQFGLLVAGGAMYLVWHVLEMYLRTVARGSFGVTS